MSLPHYIPPPGTQLPPRPRDSTVSTFLKVVHLVLVGLTTAFTPFLFMAGASCTDRTCNYGEMNNGMAVFALGPWVPVVVAIVWSRDRARRGLSTWWIHLLAAPLSLAIAYGGIALITAGSS